MRLTTPGPPDQNLPNNVSGGAYSVVLLELRGPGLPVEPGGGVRIDSGAKVDQAYVHRGRVAVGAATAAAA